MTSVVKGSGVARAVRLMVTCAALGASLIAPLRADAQGLSLRGAVDSAVRNNLDLRIARSTVDSARSETRIARAFPNPTFAVVPNTPMQYSGTLALDIGPQRIYRVRASDLGARAASADALDNARQLTLAVRRAYYDVMLADARRSIAMDRRSIIRQIVAADSARVRAGDLPERALIRSGVELIRAEADLARAAVDAQTTRLALQGLMGVTAPDTALALAGSLGHADAMVNTTLNDTDVLARRPDVLASRTREQQGVAAQRLAEVAVLPVPQLSYVRQYSGAFESGHYYSYGIGFEVPLFNQYRGQRARAAVAREASVNVRQRVEAQAAREVRSALAEFRAQQALVTRYESGVLDKVAQNVEATRYAYAHGATSLLELLDALRSQHDVMTDYYAALHDYWIAVFILEAAEGISR